MMSTLNLSSVSLPASSGSPLPPQQQSEREHLRDLTHKFEQVFLNQVLNSANKTINPAHPKSYAERTFKGMLTQEYARIMSETGKFGLADSMYNQLSAGLPGQEPSQSAPQTPPQTVNKLQPIQGPHSVKGAQPVNEPQPIQISQDQAPPIDTDKSNVRASYFGRGIFK